MVAGAVGRPTLIETNAAASAHILLVLDQHAGDRHQFRFADPSIVATAHRVMDKLLADGFKLSSPHPAINLSVVEVYLI